MRVEYNEYDDGTFYFLYVTDECRIETNGIDGLIIELRDFSQYKISDMWHYLKPADDMYFQLSTVTMYVDTIIKAVEVLDFLLRNS